MSLYDSLIALEWKYAGTYTGTSSDTNPLGVTLPSDWKEVQVYHTPNNNHRDGNMFTVSKTAFSKIKELSNETYMVERWGHYFSTTNCLQASVGITDTCIYPRSYNYGSASSVDSTIIVFYR